MHLVLALGLRIATVSVPLNPECLATLESVDRLEIPGREPRIQTVTLQKQNSCRWNLSSAREGAAVAWFIEPGTRTLDVEISADLDGEQGTALNVALLDAAGRVRKYAPYSSFRERQGALRLRFVLTSGDRPGYLVVAGATDARPILFRRVFRSASSRTLSILGLETGLDSTADIRSTAAGSFDLRVATYVTLRP